MARPLRVGLGLGVLAGLAVAGCTTPPSARYVYQDGEFGVIGVPRNGTVGGRDYHAEALDLMRRHFPDGFEIVRAEEVVEGERVLDIGRKVELDAEPGGSALNQVIKVGRVARSTSLDQKDSVHITESRIIYRRKDPKGPAGHDGFAAVATARPEAYLDPNQTMRKLAQDAALLAKKEATKAGARPGEKHDPQPPADPKVQQAAVSPK